MTNNQAGLLARAIGDAVTRIRNKAQALHEVGAHSLADELKAQADRIWSAADRLYVGILSHNAKGGTTSNRKR